MTLIRLLLHTDGIDSAGGTFGTFLYRGVRGLVSRDLSISREGSVPSRATLAYASVVRRGLEDCYPHSYIVDMLNWSRR